MLYKQRKNSIWLIKTLNDVNFCFKNIERILLVVCFISLFSCAGYVHMYAQERVDSMDYASEEKTEKLEIVALKNNLIYDATLTPNLTLEFRLAERWTMEFGVGFNPFPLDDTKYPKWRHLSVSVTPRYWFCKAFDRGFLSFNAAYAHYNVAGGTWPVGFIYKQLQDSRFQGDAVMIGEGIGWHFAISPHFSIELEAGVEAGYTWYDQFECKHCGERTAHKSHWFVLPKAGINLVVPFGGDKESLERRCDCELAKDKAKRLEREQLAAERLENESLEVSLLKPTYQRPKPILPFVPKFEPKVDNMRRLRSRLLRDEEAYEPYNENMALSADPRNVFMFFDVNVTKMDRTYLRNDLLMDSIMFIIGDALADSTIHITRIQIVGFASFDGRQSTNIKLAEGRGNTIKNYIQTTYNLPDSVFAVCNGGESWAELRYHLSKVEFEGRDEVLDIMDNEPDADVREVQIKKLHRGATYRYMRDELKQILRNLGCITVFIEENDE
jgi:hypothetical protein